MKKLSRNIALLLILAILGGTTLSSCRILQGDPRKNCNHPQHGQYMLEKRKKATGF